MLDEQESYTQVNIVINELVKGGKEIVEPLLIDFGLAHEMERGTYTKVFTTGGKKPLGTPAWMPAEFVKQQAEPSGHRIVYTKEGDIWMLGMTIHVSHPSYNDFSVWAWVGQELFARAMPWTYGLQTSPKEDYERLIRMKISEKKKPCWPCSSPNYPLQKYSSKLQKICESCYEYDPSSRPSIDKLVDDLKEALV